jgi:hypothetical protein
MKNLRKMAIENPIQFRLRQINGATFQSHRDESLQSSMSTSFVQTNKHFLISVIVIDLSQRLHISLRNCILTIRALYENYLETKRV